MPISHVHFVCPVAHIASDQASRTSKNINSISPSKQTQAMSLKLHSYECPCCKSSRGTPAGTVSMRRVYLPGPVICKTSLSQLVGRVIDVFPGSCKSDADSTKGLVVRDAFLFHGDDALCGKNENMHERL